MSLWQKCFTDGAALSSEELIARVNTSNMAADFQNQKPNLGLQSLL